MSQQTQQWIDADRFVIDQLIRPMVNLYRISANGAPVAFVRQKRMAIKEDIRFYADENETEELFRIKARSLMEIGGRYDVTTPAGERIGVLEKVFGKSLLRSTWRIYDAGGEEIGWARERNAFVAVFRRAVGLIPFIGDFLELLPIPYHFDYFVGENRIGGLERILGLRDRYRLDVSSDADRTIDRRVVLALAVGMDALQAR